MMFSAPPRLTKPGLFITATDTGVGKTTATCAIAWQLRAESRGSAAPKVGVCKPLATGCRRDREGLVSADAEALAHFADCRQALNIINPVRYAAPLAPAAAAEGAGKPVDLDLIARSLTLLDAANDVLLVEGIGGLLVPLAPRPRGDRQGGAAGASPHYLTVLDLAVALGYPVLVVARAGLGTLSHTAMTVALLRGAGCRIAGMVVNGYLADPAGAAAPSGGAGEPDTSMSSNRLWLERMTGVPILATIPACPPAQVAPERGRIAPAILDAVATTYWPDVLAAPAGAPQA